jgi:hypothetical protein
MGMAQVLSRAGWRYAARSIQRVLPHWMLNIFELPSPEMAHPMSHLAPNIRGPV